MNIKLTNNFHSATMNIKDFEKLIRDFMSDTNPGEKIKSIDTGDSVKVKFESGREVEIEVDWNELTIKEGE